MDKWSDDKWIFLGQFIILIGIFLSAWFTSRAVKRNYRAIKEARKREMQREVDKIQ